MYELHVVSNFSAAHRLRGYKGKCENLHGHNWRVEVVVGAEELDKLGMVVDFKVVKQRLTQVLDKYDHRFLNRLPAFRRSNPTTENIAREISEQLTGRLPAKVRVKNVTVWEAPGCSASYFPEHGR
jgi:6-pyruvoyltetrahydropterin/6-carboxytetrahydropterin synthase